MKPTNHFTITAISTLLLVPAAFAGNTWDGGGGNGNWTTAANWNGDTAPNYASLLTFAGTTNLITNNDSATSSVAGLTFSSGAGAFTLNGSSVTLGGNIVNNSTSVQTVNLPLVLDANRQIQTNSGGIVLGGQISGAYSLIQTGTGGTLTLNTAGSSFSLYQINSGTTKLGVNDALPTASGVTFATAANSATLDLNGKTQTLGANVTIAGSGGAGTVTINDTAGGGVLKLGGNVTQNAVTTNTVTISAALDLNGATRTFTLNNSSAAFTVSGSIGNSTGTAGLTKAGVGTLNLSGANTHNGTTTVSAGLLTLGNALALQNSTLDTTNSIASSSTTTGLKTTVTTLTMGGLSGNKNLASLFDSANGYSGVTALTLNPAMGQTPSYSGVIANGAANMTLTKSGAGTQTLSGANTYSGGTNLTAGILNFGHATALSTGAISFTGNSTLQAGVATTLANAVSVATGVTASVDTNNFATTLGGALTGAGNLTKTGDGTLNISGGALANTLSGTINVNAGTLAIDNVNPSPGIQSFANMNGDITVASGATFNFSQSFTAYNLDNNITLSGAGTGGLGALNLWRNATATGAITLAADATISHNFNTATISGSITGANRNLTLTTINSAQPGMVISGTVSLGTGGITVNGAGGTNTVTLSGNNTYSGDTLVTAGTLLVSNATGSGTGSGAVTVNTAATLGGTGRISGAVNVSGVLSPGASIESLGTGALTLGNGSAFEYEMNTATVGADLLHVTGGLNIGSNVTLDLTDLAPLSQALAPGTKFTLLSYTGLWNSGAFDGHADDSTFLFAGNEWLINYNDLSGGSNFTSDQNLATGFVTLTVIPEPSSAVLLGLGALLVRRRRGN